MAIQIILITIPIILYFESKAKENKTYSILKKFENNTASGLDLLFVDSKYQKCLNAYYAFEPINNVLGRIFIGIGIITIGIGLFIFLWMIDGSNIGMVFAKIGSIIIALITLIVEIIYIKIDSLRH